MNHPGLLDACPHSCSKALAAQTVPEGIRICSTLNCTYQAALEDLLFFNPQQLKVRSQIVNCVEQYGAPWIISKEGLLRVKVEKLPEVQTLYAMDLRADPPTLIGVMVYVRASEEDVVLLHISVAKQYSAGVSRSNGLLVLTLLSTLRSICRRIKGIRNILLFYKAEHFTKISVPRATVGPSPTPPSNQAHLKTAVPTQRRKVPMRCSETSPSDDSLLPKIQRGSCITG